MNKDKGITRRKWEDGYEVRAMTLEEAAITNDWWAPSLKLSSADIETCFEVFPHDHGAFVGEFQGEMIASLTCPHWGGGIYYGSCYYVTEKLRGRGFGRRLWDEVASSHVGKSLLAIDAVEKYEQMYQRSGMVMTSGGVHIYEGVPMWEGLEEVSSDGLQILPVTSLPFDQLIEYDDKCFIMAGSAYRRAFLKQWIQVKGGAAFVAKDACGIVGFGCRRPCMQPDAHVIGPLYANNPEIAKTLLRAICRDIPGMNIGMSIWSNNPAATELASGVGLQMTLPMVRMYKNGAPTWGANVYSITSSLVCGF